MAEIRFKSAGEAAFGGIAILLGLPLVVVGFYLLLLPFSLYMAWVITRLSAWFLVPRLHMPYLPFWQVYGMTLVFSVLRGTPVVKGEKVDVSATLATGVLNNSLVLLVGWAVHHWLL